MQHPSAHLLVIEFDVPIPSKAQLSSARFLWTVLLVAYVALVGALTLPRFDVFAFMMVVPVLVAVSIYIQSPRVKRVAVDNKSRTVEIVDLLRGIPRTRIIPFGVIQSVDYDPGHHSPKFVRPASISIKMTRPYEDVRMTRIGLTQHEDLRRWLCAMILGQ